MEMRKDMFGEPAGGILPDAFEHDVPEIIEQHACKARARISHDQSNGERHARLEPRLHPVNRGAIEEPHADLDALGHQHQRERDDDAQPQPRHVLWPKIGDEPPHDGEVESVISGRRWGLRWHC